MINHNEFLCDHIVVWGVYRISSCSFPIPFLALSKPHRKSSQFWGCWSRIPPAVWCDAHFRRPWPLGESTYGRSDPIPEGWDFVRCSRRLVRLLSKVSSAKGWGAFTSYRWLDCNLYFPQVPPSTNHIRVFPYRFGKFWEFAANPKNSTQWQ